MSIVWYVRHSSELVAGWRFETHELYASLIRKNIPTNIIAIPSTL